MGALLLLIILAAIYFIPTIIAANRHHPNAAGIFCVNLFLGWSLIGWVVALVWAVSDTGETTHTIQITNSVNRPAVQSASPVSDGGSGIAEEILKLHQLKEKGVITEDEFNEQKKIILGRANTAAAASLA